MAIRWPGHTRSDPEVKKVLCSADILPWEAANYRIARFNRHCLARLGPIVRKAM